MRTIKDLNEGWQFAGEAASLEDALKNNVQSVTLPHTWNAQDGQDGSRYLRAKCWYLHELTFPSLQSGEEIWAEFLGANLICEVYLNGQKLARHEGGYTAFRANLTPAIEENNLLAVSVDNNVHNEIYPHDADFTFYGGLYREVRLITVPAAHFALGYYGGSGLRLTPAVRGRDADVTAEVWTEGAARSVSVTIADETKNTVLENGYAAMQFTIKDVHLWDGLDDPYLYTAHAVLDSGDEVYERFGCRTFNIDPNQGFFLNGRSYPLRGVARHQDRLGAGNALTHEMHREDMDIVLELGANTLRLAHYPHHPYFYDLCDECGVIVWVEIPYISRHVPEARESTLVQMKELIVQNYNRPSIVCWGLSNEISMLSKMDDDLLENHRLLQELCHSLDATRPTTMAHENTLEKNSELQAIPDIGSYNLYFGWYKGELEDNGTFLDDYHALHPDRCIGLSEYGADANPAYQSAHPERGDFSETYQALYHEKLLEIIEARPYLWATHVWNLFDFSAARRNDGGIPGRNQKGLVTMDRKLRKDAFYLYKAHWSQEPFVHLCGRRYVDRTEDITEIKAYSNQSEVSLFVDGALMETKRARHVFRFKLPFAGEVQITAKAGACTDAMRIRKVEQPNHAYAMPVRASVLNWFDQDAFKKDFCSIKDTLGSLLDNPAAGERTRVFCEKLEPGMFEDDVMARFLRGMALEKIINRNLDKMDRDEVQAFNAFLQRTPKQ